MRLERQLSNAQWIEVKDQEQIDNIIERALARDARLAPLRGHETMKSPQQVLDAMAGGQEVRYDDDWYMNMRDADALKPRESEIAEPQLHRCRVCGQTNLDGAMFTTLRGGDVCDDCVR